MNTDGYAGFRWCRSSSRQPASLPAEKSKVDGLLDWVSVGRSQLAILCCTPEAAGALKNLLVEP
ncbi:MAG: hypothetical protein WCG47_32950, partial [Dermatophilaceae bacterium]